MRKFAVLLIALSIFLSLPLTVQAQARQSTALATSSSAQSLGIAQGAHIRPAINYDQVINTYNSASGKPIAVLMYFLDWSGVPNSPLVFDTYLPNLIDNLNPVPAIMLSWEPMNGRKSEGCDQDYGTSIPLTNITQGKCDNYIREFAKELSARPERYLLRYAHEMNITDSPWWPGHYGQTASAYVAMWQHVHDIIAGVQNSLGKHNIEWVWSINYASNPTDAWNAIPNYYPGDSYVDWIGLSGYNWYNSPGHNQPWMSFTDIFDTVLKNLTSWYAKPQILTEIGSVGTDTQKSSWIQDAYAKMPNYPYMRGVVWFNDFAYANTTQADFRVINTPNLTPVSPLITAAYDNSIASGTYVTSLPSLNLATPVRNLSLDKHVFLPSLHR